jgi:tRNA (guanine10-N2)-dimethyltransferase|nr:MAG: RNA methyltransferase [Vulcanisaeta sp. AZ3]
MVRLRVEVNKDLGSLAYHELEALAELVNGSLVLVDESEYLLIDYYGSAEALRNVLCRASLIKRVWIVEDHEHLITDLNRSRYRVLKRGREKGGSASVDLRIARLLVNLARVRDGSVFLDPFIGNGIIAYEALMLGARVIGVDINNKFLRSIHNAHMDIANSDFSLAPIKDGAIDAIATDPPYNRLSIIDIDIDTLYRRFAEEAYRVLRAGGYLAFSHPTYIGALDWFISTGFKLIGSGLQRVHGGLTRLIYVFKK